MKILGWLKKDTKGKLAELLDGFELPSFPEITMEALSALRDNNASMRKVAGILQRDPGIHVKILRIVNSAAYGLSTKVGNMQHAATLLGRSRLESILLSHAVKDSLPPVHIPNFDCKKFWLTASRRANLAYMLSDYLHPVFKEESFTVGLLQDMGVPAIASVKQKEYNKLLEKFFSSDVDNIAILENDAFGFDHQRVGSLMAEEWNLPEYIGQSIKDHHSLSDGARDLAARLVSSINEKVELEDVEKMIDDWSDVVNVEKEKLKSLVGEAFKSAESFFKSFY